MRSLDKDVSSSSNSRFLRDYGSEISDAAPPFLRAFPDFPLFSLSSSLRLQTQTSFPSSLALSLTVFDRLRISAGRMRRQASVVNFKFALFPRSLPFQRKIRAMSSGGASRVPFANRFHHLPRRISVPNVFPRRHQRSTFFNPLIRCT